MPVPCGRGPGGAPTEDEVTRGWFLKLEPKSHYFLRCLLSRVLPDGDERQVPLPGGPHDTIFLEAITLTLILWGPGVLGFTQFSQRPGAPESSQVPELQSCCPCLWVPHVPSFFLFHTWGEFRSKRPDVKYFRHKENLECCLNGQLAS